MFASNRYLIPRLFPSVLVTSYSTEKLGIILVLVPDPKPTPARIAFSIVRVILEAIYVAG